jgi:hypothetical protein
MNNTYGLSLLLGMTLGCRDIYCLSDFSEDNLLSAIQQFKVDNKNPIKKIFKLFLCSVLYLSVKAGGNKLVSGSHRLAL